MWKSAVLTMSLIAPSVGAAGNDAGGGAGAVVCRDSTTGAITKAEILDLYEARMGGVRLRAVLAGDDEEYMAFLDARAFIRTSKRPVRSAGDVAAKLADFHKTVRDYYRFTTAGERVEPTGDFGRTARPPGGCRVEQLARFDDHRKTILIDSEIWASFDARNRVALFAHEFFYRQYRMAGESDSARARSLLGFVFAETPLAFVRDGVPAGALSCQGAGLGLALNTEFYLFENPLRRGETVMQFASVSGRETLWPTRLYLPISINLATVRNRGNDGVRISDPDLDFAGDGRLEGGSLEGASVHLSLKFDEPVQLMFGEGMRRAVTIQNCQRLEN